MKTRIFYLVMAIVIAVFIFMGYKSTQRAEAKNLSVSTFWGYEQLNGFRPLVDSVECFGIVKSLSDTANYIAITSDRRAKDVSSYLASFKVFLGSKNHFIPIKLAICPIYSQDGLHTLQIYLGDKFDFKKVILLPSKDELESGAPTFCGKKVEVIKLLSLPRSRML